METKTLVIDTSKQVGIIVSVGAIALTMMPYNAKLCEKWGVTKEQFLYLKLHFKNNPKQALNDLLIALEERRKE